MATETVKATKTVCDGCGKTFWADADDVDDPVLGYHGTTMWHGPLGGGGFTWFACSERCIKKAVVNARNRMWAS